MIPELGKYAIWVLSAYGVSLVLIAGLVVLTLVRGARIRRALRDTELRQKAARNAGSATDGRDQGRALNG